MSQTELTPGTTARDRPWLRRDSERPIDSSDDSRPSGLSIQSANSAAVAYRLSGDLASAFRQIVSRSR